MERDDNFDASALVKLLRLGLEPKGYICNEE